MPALPAGGDLDQELRPHRLEQAFDFAFPLGAAGPRVGDLDAQHGQRVQQLPGHVRAAVIDVEGLRGAVRLYRPPQRGEQPRRVLLRGPPVPGDEPGMIILDAEQVRLGGGTGRRAVQHVGDPQLTGRTGLEPAEPVRDRPGTGRAGQVHPHEMPLDGPHRGHLPGGQPGRQDPGDLGGRPLRLLLLQRHRQLQHGRVAARRDLPATRDQGVEAAGAPTP